MEELSLEALETLANILYLIGLRHLQDPETTLYVDIGGRALEQLRGVKAERSE